MDVQAALLLFLAGLAGGIINALAGGATLITFPAMMAAGLPAVIANASSAVAITPGALLAAWADRSKLPPLDARTFIALAAALVGGAMGSIILLATSERIFTLLVPALIGGATAIFALAPRIRAAVSSRAAGGDGRPALRASALAAISVYGGYFGAGLGIMLLATLAITDGADLRTINALKNLLSTVVSAAAVTIFVFMGSVSWPQTFAMLIGAICGGLAGGRLIQILPSTMVARIVIVTGCVMTAIYAWRYWM
jgi:uncharacterized protein